MVVAAHGPQRLLEPLKHAGPVPRPGADELVLLADELGLAGTVLLHVCVEVLPKPLDDLGTPLVG